MKRTDFTLIRRYLGLRLLLMFLVLLSGMHAYGDEVKSENSDVPTLNSEGCYEIYNATQLKWFRDLVNGTLTDGTAQHYGASAKLMADIDLNNEEWTPIGRHTIAASAPYYGIFDGNYHTVSNLNVQSGFFRGFIGFNEGTIKNLGIINANIGSGGGFAGVIAAKSNISAIIQNCWTVGDITIVSDDECMGMAGITTNGLGVVATNCHTSYSTAVYDLDATDESRITNCTANISADAHQTGELTYLLNTNKADDETCSWGQTIGTDAHPVALTETNKVYQYGTPQDATTITIKVDQSYNRTATLCFPKDVSLPVNVKAFVVTELKSTWDNWFKTAVMKELETPFVPANTPVILMNTGTEDAVVQLPAVSYCYSNNATGTISQAGNLLAGTYTSLGLNTQKQFALKSSRFSCYNRTETLPAYQCYIESESTDFIGLSTDKPIGEIEYNILSEEDKTCYVSHLFYAGIGTSDYEVTIPATIQIAGTDYQVVQFGQCNDDNADKVNFVNMDCGMEHTLYVNLPKTIRAASKQAILRSSLDRFEMFFMEESMVMGRTCTRFSTEEAPEFKGSSVDRIHFCYTQIDVPYAADGIYWTAWGGDSEIHISSRTTTVDIANGIVEINDDQYTQGDNTSTINGTLVIKGSSTTNYIFVKGGTTDEPLRIAINGLSIDQSEVGVQELPAMSMTPNTNVSLIVQGNNTFKNSENVSSIEMVDGDSFSINPLSTGKLSVCGVTGGNVAVAAKVYEGSNEYATQTVTKATEFNYANNQLAFSDNNLLTDVDNLVANGTCQKLVLNDAVDVYSPSAFKANAVTYRRTFTDTDFESLYLPFSACVDDFQDCEFYVINMFHQNDTDGDGVLDNITLEVGKVPAGSILLPNHPYLFKYKGGTLGDAVEFSLSDIDVSATESTSYECSSMSYKYTFTGNHQSQSADDLADCYVIGIDNTTNKTALVRTTEPLQAMRWAMKMTARDSQIGQKPATVNSLESIAIGIEGDDTVTGISSVSSEEGTAASYYGINGVRKSQMTKGINIVKTADGKVMKVVKQ